MKERRGIRFSIQDAIVILVAAVATLVMWKTVPLFAPALPIVLGHFFLFCNVFLVPRRLELIWAAVFLINGAFWMVMGMGEFDWWAVLACQAPVTVGFIVWTMRNPNYRGVLSKKME